MRPEKPFVTPRALELGEIPGIIGEYRKGAENAKRAGFDGVELCMAPMATCSTSFCRTAHNRRTDEYGRPD